MHMKKQTHMKPLKSTCLIMGELCYHNHHQPAHYYLTEVNERTDNTAQILAWSEQLSTQDIAKLNPGSYY